MKTRETALERGDRILIHLRQRVGPDRHQCLGNVPYYLASAILEQNTFENIESLIAFCGDPESLRPWLPNEADRLVFSDELVRRLREICPDPHAKPRDSVEADPARAAVSCPA